MRTVELGKDVLRTASTGTVYVKSRSKRGLFHTIRNGRCDCPGFTYRNTCWHVEAAVGVLGEDAVKPMTLTADQIALRTCRTCGVRIEQSLSQQCFDCIVNDLWPQ